MPILEGTDTLREANTQKRAILERARYHKQDPILTKVQYLGKRDQYLRRAKIDDKREREKV